MKTDKPHLKYYPEWVIDVTCNIFLLSGSLIAIFLLWLLGVFTNLDRKQTYTVYVAVIAFSISTVFWSWWDYFTRDKYDS